MVRLAKISRYVLKNIKGCKQTERDYTTRRDFLFLTVKKWKNINVKRQCKLNTAANCEKGKLEKWAVAEHSRTNDHHTTHKME